MTSATHEVAILLLLVLGGTSLAWFLGFRNAVLLATVGFALSILMRTSIFLIFHFFDIAISSRLAWGAASLVAFLLAALFARRHQIFWMALLLAAGLGVIAFLTKYLLNIGERFHEDSVQIIGNSILVFSSDGMSSEIKRGLAYPLMLALGQEDHIFSSFTPLVFLNLLILSIWTGMRITRRIVEPRVYLLIAMFLVAVSATSPMVRTLVFYINSHTMVALGAALVISGLILSVHSVRLEPQTFAVIATGSILASWARYEGAIVILLALLPFISSELIRTRLQRVNLFAVAISPAVAWLIWSIAAGADFRVLSMVTISGPALWAILGIIAIPLGLWVTPPLDKLRRHTPSIVGIPLAIFVMFIFEQKLTSTSLPAQIRNIFFGLGGWGFVAPAFLLLLVLFGYAHASREYRKLIGMLALAIPAAFFIKFLDGQAMGRQGFNDSINRSWAHWLPLFWLIASVGMARIWPWGQRGTQGMTSLSSRSRVRGRAKNERS